MRIIIRGDQAEYHALNFMVAHAKNTHCHHTVLCWTIKDFVVRFDKVDF